jgi:hypothetical protein
MVRRIAENHAISMSGMFLINKVMGREGNLKDLNDYVIALAKNKVETARSETPLADAFLELIEDVEAPDAVRCEDGMLYVRVSHALKAINWHPSVLNDLCRNLKECDRFKGQKSTRLFGKVTTAWTFSTLDIERDVA